jgi:methionine-rich copper-binding protein CopC
MLRIRHDYPQVENLPMRFLAPLVAPFALLAALAMSGTASAAPIVDSTSPAEKADAAKVTQITIHFQDAINPAASGIQIWMTGMPGMDHHDPMKMNGVKVSVSPDAKSLIATLGRPLPEGTYAARWFATDKNAQKAEGSLTFNAR